MSTARGGLSACVDGIAVIGPGIADWPSAAAVLNGTAAYAGGPTPLPAPLALPAAERRRAGRVIKLALALGAEAAGHAGLDPGSLLTVFSSSGGDGENCHAICETLASADRQMSPTRFHHSVHNVPAGYWSIATGAMAASTVLCAHDASFAAGLLEALTQVAAEAEPVLLIAYDAPYPSPLHEKRPLPAALGVALALAPERTARSLARLSAEIAAGTVDRMTDPQLESLRARVPAWRCLPLLERLARREAGRVLVDYFEPTALAIEIAPC